MAFKVSLDLAHFLAQKLFLDKIWGGLKCFLFLSNFFCEWYRFLLTGFLQNKQAGSGPAS